MKEISTFDNHLPMIHIKSETLQKTWAYLDLKVNWTETAQGIVSCHKTKKSF